MGRKLVIREDYSADITSLGRIKRRILADWRRPVAWRQNVAVNLQAAIDALEKAYAREALARRNSDEEETG